MYYFYLGVFFINYIDVNIGFQALRSSGAFLCLNVLSVSTFECQMNVGIHCWRLWRVAAGGGEYLNILVQMFQHQIVGKLSSFCVGAWRILEIVNLQSA